MQAAAVFKRGTTHSVAPPAAAQGLHGLHGLQAEAAQGLQGLHGLHATAAQGLHGLHGPHGFLAAQGLHGLQAAATRYRDLVAARGVQGTMVSPVPKPTTIGMKAVDRSRYRNDIARLPRLYREY